MAIGGCVLPACCCQPAVAGGIIYADLSVELNTHLDPQALFTQSSVSDATATSFPLSKNIGGGDTAAFSVWCVYLQLKWEVGLPPSPVEFSSLRHSHKFSHSWSLGVCPCSRPLQPGLACLFPVPRRIPLPSSLVHRVLHLFAMCTFIVLIAYYSVSLFSPGGGWSVQGAYADLAQGCLWKYHTPFSSPCGPRLPSHLGASDWR
jgi:hypothetical protein